MAQSYPNLRYQNSKNDILRYQGSLASLCQSNMHLSVRMSVAYAWNILLTQRLWARTHLLDVFSAPSGSPGTAVTRLRLQLEAPKVQLPSFVTGPDTRMDRDIPAEPKCHGEVSSPSVPRRGRGGIKLFLFAWLAAPVPHLGLGEHKLV